MSKVLVRATAFSLAALMLTACSQSADEPANQAAPSASTPVPTASEGNSATAVENKKSGQSGQSEKSDSGPDFAIDAPAGSYRLDPNHSSLAFTVRHLGLSNYVTRFSRHDVSIELDTDNIEESSVSVTIDPKSVSTLYQGDYKGTHPDSKFSTWNEDLARSDKFFNAEKFPEITFKSTDIKVVDEHELEITGDLTLLGKTRPITLSAILVGSAQKHPVNQNVEGAMGFSAIGEFKRSEFGMNYLLKPPLIGDSVVINFEGEFQQKTAE